MNPLDFFTDLFNPNLAFLPKALAVAVISSIVCGVVGTHVVLRGMAFIGDAVSHAVFPGLAIAFVIGGNLVLGGVFAGVATAVLVAVFSQNRRLNESSIIGVFFVAAFALGVVIISQAPGYAGSLEQFLFGSITGIPDSDLYVAGITGLVVLAVIFLLHKEFVTISLDRESARALGVPVFWLDLALYVLVTLAVVISVQTIGNILVLALLVTPAATARMLTDRLGVMMLLSPAIGAAGAFAGLYLSWSWDIPTGGTIVLVLSAAFLLAWLFAPRQGVLVKAVHRARQRATPAPAVPVTAAGILVSQPELVDEESPVEAEPVLRSGSDEGSAVHGNGLNAGGRHADGRQPRRLGWLLPTVTGLLVALGAAAVIAAALAEGDHPDPAGSAPADLTAPSAAPAAAPTPAGVGLPANAQDAPISELADADWVSETARKGDIPERALAAYAGAALTMAQSTPTCKIGWNTLAAIGQIESHHGTLNGAHLDDRGVATPTIVGIPLDGTGKTTEVPDTDDGRQDGDSRWDRAVGPMQFIPATWEEAAQDGNKDGAKDVNQIDDAALAAATHLCSVGGDLSDPNNWIAAIGAYNDSTEYNHQIAEVANQFAVLR